MAKKKVEEVQVPEEIMKKDIQAELTDYVDNHLKKELIGYVDEKIKQEFLDELGKSHKRVIKEKNKKILYKNISIILLLGIIVFLTYQLYELNYFNQFFVKEETKTIEERPKESKEIVQEEEEKLPSLEELKAKYESLLTPYCFNSQSNYLKDFYEGKLSSEIKHYFVMNHLDFNSFEQEEDYYVIAEETIQKEYQNLFKDEEQASSFEYNGTKIRYINKLDSYMTDTMIQKMKCDIIRNIIEIQEKGNQVLITTEETAIEWEENTVNTITYVFEDNKLVSLMRKENGI